MFTLPAELATAMTKKEIAYWAAVHYGWEALAKLIRSDSRHAGVGPREIIRQVLVFLCADSDQIPAESGLNLTIEVPGKDAKTSWYCRDMLITILTWGASVPLTSQDGEMWFVREIASLSDLIDWWPDVNGAAGPIETAPIDSDCPYWGEMIVEDSWGFVQPAFASNEAQIC